MIDSTILGSSFKIRRIKLHQNILFHGFGVTYLHSISCKNGWASGEHLVFRNQNIV